jgi:hypothetical protein
MIKLQNNNNNNKNNNKNETKQKKISNPYSASGMQSAK